MEREVLKVILDGLYDEESHLSRRRGMYHILKFIWKNVRNFSDPFLVISSSGPTADLHSDILGLYFLIEEKREGRSVYTKALSRQVFFWRTDTDI